ncbi:TRAPP subunit BET5 [Lachancea thermotolerans CBS 6340]|uniref:Trafficking protein particle complex subunit n=1 Tax=Lachancea thermotolerans (strain ATCC 56472 / CBS 6340 / NRRL Y-8284) TaxID=559295 RepID=C5DFP7_LACTC|nr:KLTH0D16874p [Lachancea thermotolerans CBS 6340]CAR23002.1 KLTH0D16874p [Lachancea thermotolerans CBS 6340]
MAIYSFWIFDRHLGNCIFDREWTLKSNQSSGTTNSKLNEDTAKLLYGMVFSLRSISQKLSGEGSHNEIRTISTGKYRAHILCTASGLWFVLLSDLKQEDLSHVLRYLYSEIYVKTVVHNWFSPVDFAESDSEKRGQGFRKIRNRNFLASVERFLGPMVN